MATNYLLLGFYLLLGWWLVPRVPFVKHAGLTQKEVQLLFSFKMVVGLCLAFYFTHFSLNFDYVGYNAEGTQEYQLLKENPRQFFNGFSGYLHTYGAGHLFETTNSAWGYFRFILLFKLIAITDLLSQGNFYFNTAIFSTLVFFGHLALYRVYRQIYPGQKLTVLVATFLLPSILLYTACIDKDGLIFIGIAVACYIFHRFVSVPKNNVTVKYGLLFLVALAIIFLFRNYVLVAMLPAMLIGMLCKWLPFKKRYTVLVTYAVFLLLFFLSGFSDDWYNLPAAVVQRKADFAALSMGNTGIAMNELNPSAKSFLYNLPKAINHYFMRPYLWEFSQRSVLLTAIELLFYQLIILIFIFYRKRSTTPIHPFNIFGLLFVLNMMLIIGYTIPNIGAIVRYRSIFWVFLICPALCNIDWQRVPLFGTQRN